MEKKHYYKDELLLIEDNPNSKEIFFNCFQSRYQLHYVEKAEDALSLLFQGEIYPVCIALDYKLPKMNGLEFLKVIKKIERFKHIPIVLQSGLEFNQDIAKGIIEGACYYLPKPYSMDLLKSVIEGAIYSYRFYINLIKSSLGNFPLPIDKRNKKQLLGRSERRILIVSNNPEEVALIKKCLKDTNYHLFHLTGKEILGLEIENLYPDILLFDYLLCESTGTELLTNLKKRNAHIITIILTDSKSFNMVSENLFPMADYFLIKSKITPHDFKQTIERIYQNVEMQRKIVNLSYKDNLTGLLNRKSIINEVQRQIKQCKKRNEKFAILFISIDNFKPINDAYGYNVGDTVLLEFSKRLMDQLPKPSDLLGRFGGDEFIFVIKNVVESMQCITFAEKINKILSRPFSIRNNNIILEFRIGISLFPDDGVTREELFQKADIAMYRAKNQIDKPYALSNDSLQQEIIKKIKIKLDVREAILKEEFYLCYQPKVNCSKKLMGLEALVRWQSPKHGLVPPNNFIPIIEESNLIIKLGKWIIKEVSKQIKSWEKDRHALVPISINLSALQLMDKNIIADFKQHFLSKDIPPHLVEIEITESVMMKNIEHTVDVLKAIDELGIKIALDDFGTGFSSLNRLVRLPIHILKIDKSFINDILTDENSKIVAAFIIDLSKKLNIDVVAEGVETKEQFDYLKQEGCQFIQGYYFSEPLKTHECAKLLVLPFL